MNVIEDFRTGEPITLHQATNSVEFENVPNPLYMKLLWFERYGPIYQLKIQIRFNYNLRRALNLHKCWIELTITGSNRILTGPRFLKVLKKRLEIYLDNLGLICINNVIRGLNHVLYEEFTFVSSVIQNQSVAMNLY
ncbi:ORFC3 [Beet curly top virus - California [Logan]]|uniref:replication enhancer protein n=1 Tax=Beet curly top virus TaxID=10840 RepID=UPI00001380E5|nr:replication enhancer protein [Beet curly top virus]AAA42754.1 ORFC3 [Beet curly top virus - California [Logan]]